MQFAWKIYKKQNMYSDVSFYEKDNEQHEIHFPVQLGRLKVVNSLGEYSNISSFNEISIILLMFTGSQDLFLGVYTDLIIGKLEKY